MNGAVLPELASAFPALWLRWAVAETVYSLLLALLFVGLLRLFRVRRAAFHQGAWMLVLLRLVVPPGWAAPFSLRSAAAWACGRWLPSALAPHAGISVETRLLGPIGTGGGGFLLPLGLLLAWAPVACLLGILMALRYLRYRRIAARAARVGEARLNEVLARWRRTFRIRRHVRFVSSEACLTPFTTGLLKPVVYLPKALLEWPGAMVEPVIAHELAHVARWDELWILVAGALRAVYFFNPAVWLATSRLARCREELCDAKVLCLGEVSPSDYGRSLMEVLRLNLFGTGAMDALAGLINGKEVVEMRLLSILSEKGHPLPRPGLFASATLVAGLVLLPMAALQGPSGAGAVHLMAASGEKVQPASQKIYPMGDKRLVPPKVVTQINPSYPQEAQKKGIQGRAVVEVVISESGTVAEARVVKEEPAGHGFGQAAVAAARQWRFEPATLDRKPVAVWWLIAINFKLS